jgi:adenylate cyclase
MKVLHGAWFCSLKQINKGIIKIFDTPYIRVLQVLLKECFPWGYCKPSGLSKQYKTPI